MYKYKIGKLPGYACVIENYFDILSEFGVDEFPINMCYAHFAGIIEWAHRQIISSTGCSRQAVFNGR